MLGGRFATGGIGDTTTGDFTSGRGTGATADEAPDATVVGSVASIGAARSGTAALGTGSDAPGRTLALAATDVSGAARAVSAPIF